MKNVNPSRIAWRSLPLASGKISARRSCSCRGKGPTTPNWSRGTHFTGRRIVSAGGTAMSKIPDPAVPASCTRCASNWASVGTFEPSSAFAGKVRPIAIKTVRVIEGLGVIFSLESPTVILSAHYLSRSPSSGVAPRNRGCWFSCRALGWTAPRSSRWISGLVRPHHRERVLLQRSLNFPRLNAP